VASRNDVSIVAPGNIIDATASEAANIYGKSISLVSSSGGTLGTSSDDLDVYVNYSSSGGSLTASASGLINISQYTGNLYLNTVSSAAGNINLYTPGSILTSTVLPVINVSGMDLNLTAGTAVGSSANPIEVDADGNVVINAPGPNYVHQN
jgi:phage gp45-like